MKKIEDQQFRSWPPTPSWEFMRRDPPTFYEKNFRTPFNPGKYFSGPRESITQRSKPPLGCNRYTERRIYQNSKT